MKVIRINKDIYNRNGVLLLAAGQVVTSDMLKRLEAIDYINIKELLYEENYTVVNKEKYSGYEKDTFKNDIRKSAQKIKLALKIKNVYIFDSASEILENIIFKSRNTDWAVQINVLSNYVDWMYSHSIDVAILSIMTAQVLRMDDKLEDIALGAFFHDIGKLLVPKKILQKPEKLTDDEMYYMQQHCDLGYGILKNYGFSPVSLDIILQHHERLDGSGYPQGLKSDEIPLHSKIAMVADSLAAMTSYRPFRPSKSIDVALKELREQNDKYPQEIVNILSQLM